MRLTVNGEPRDISGAATLDTLLCDMGVDPVRVATLLNDEVVSREKRSETSLKVGDRIEAFTFACGG